MQNPALLSCRPQTLPATIPEILCNSYFISPKGTASIAPYGFAAFSALLVLSDSRSFMRALCS